MKTAIIILALALSACMPVSDKPITVAPDTVGRLFLDASCSVPLDVNNSALITHYWTDCDGGQCRKLYRAKAVFRGDGPLKLNEACKGKS